MKGNKLSEKQYKRTVRRARIRSRVVGSAEKPRLSVYRSTKYIYAQIVDDKSGKTLASASDLLLKDKKTKTDRAVLVGKTVAELGVEKKIKQVVFDRGGFVVKGRVKALAEAAREAGLSF